MVAAQHMAWNYLTPSPLTPPVSMLAVGTAARTFGVSLLFPPLSHSNFLNIETRGARVSAYVNNSHTLGLHRVQCIRFILISITGPQAAQLWPCERHGAHIRLGSSACLSVCLFVGLSVCLSVCFVYLSVRVFVCLCVRTPQRLLVGHWNTVPGTVPDRCPTRCPT